MWANKIASGLIPPAELVRMDAGTICIYEKGEPGNKLAILIQSYATRAKARLKMTSINGFDGNEPCYLLRVEVVIMGEKLKKRGRKLTSKRGN